MKLPTTPQEWDKLNEGKQREILAELYLEHRNNNQVAKRLTGVVGRQEVRQKLRAFGLNVTWLKQNTRILTPPKMLYLDIETAPIEAWVWALFKQNVSLSQIKDDWYMLSWCGMWEHDRKPFGDSLHFHQNKQEWFTDDLPLCKSLYDALDEADVVIAHNGRAFDIPKITARLITQGFSGPPSPYRQIDTLKASRQHRFTSNKLDWLASLFLGRNKIKTDFDLWSNCRKGKVSAFKEMYKYNMRDVEILRDVYIHLRPWMNAHPNLAVMMGDTVPRCASCLSERLEFAGYRYTNVSKFKAYRCLDCGHLSNERTSDLTKEQRKSLLISTAR